jgi:hypothetical protein
MMWTQAVMHFSKMLDKFSPQSTIPIPTNLLQRHMINEADTLKNE